MLEGGVVGQRSSTTRSYRSTREGEEPVLSQKQQQARAGPCFNVHPSRSGEILCNSGDAEAEMRYSTHDRHTQSDASFGVTWMHMGV